MAAEPLALSLTLEPRSRFDAIDVTRRIREELGDVLRGYARVLYCSHHTTAGYLEQRLAERLESRRDRLEPFFRAFQALFPRGAGYRHDRMELRSELSEEQRHCEPPNADAHLTFIGAGLQSCVTYRNRPDTPVYFMDLDGVFEGRRRCRRTSVVAYSEEAVVDETWIEVPMSRHAIDSVNLGDPRIGLADAIDAMLERNPVEHGRVDIALDHAEGSAAVTVNEYETLLMRHDLAVVLGDPLRFMARQGKHILRDPMAVPAKSLGYARYDAVQIVNELIDALGLGESAVERLLGRLMAFPAARLLRFKRSLSLPVTTEGGRPHVVRGRYQSPIMIQWSATPRRARTLRVGLTRLG